MPGIDNSPTREAEYSSLDRAECQDRYVAAAPSNRASKRLILTASGLSNDAVVFIERIEGKVVVLIDGEQLADFMINRGLGVTTLHISKNGFASRR
jgi:restriction system protein